MRQAGSSKLGSKIDQPTTAIKTSKLGSKLGSQQQANKQASKLGSSH